MWFGMRRLILLLLTIAMISSYSAFFLHLAAQKEMFTADSKVARGKRISADQFGKLNHTKHHNDKAFLDNMTDLELKLSNESVVWPTLFLIGAPKAASSTFHELLVQHPQLCTARSARPGRAAKEVGFLFATLPKVFLLSLYGRAPGGHDRRCADLAKTSSKAFWYMDNHPIYLQGFEQKMKAMIPPELHAKLRFLVVLREPLARSISQFNHQRAPGLSQ